MLQRALRLGAPKPFLRHFDRPEGVFLDASFTHATPVCWRANRE